MSGEPARFAMLADDLTGALDCAAAFLPSGFSPYVAISGEVPAGIGADLVSLNLDTRRMGAADASAAVRSAVERAADAGLKLFYVKIDSTMRGHPGLEISEAAGATRASAAVICPAFPSTGRTVRDGTLFVHGTPLADTEVGRDPLSPANTSRVTEMLESHCDASIIDVPLEIVRRRSLAGLTGGVAGRSISLVCCDAETDEDLAKIASLYKTSRNILFAGSAGLAGALARAIALEAPPSSANHKRLDSGPVLVVTASKRSLADQQIAGAEISHGLSIVSVEFRIGRSGSLTGPGFDAKTAGEQLAGGSHIALRATIDGGLTRLSPADIRDVADKVTTKLGRIVADICKRARPSAIVLIGGDTALAALSALDAHGIFLRSQPLPGVPVGVIAGGQLDGVTVATKAGAFGDERTLTRLFDYLLNGRAER